MGRRSINTTKSGKFMNPTDQARKEARKRELKKNKKQRQMVRAAVLKGKDPQQLVSDMEKIDEMEYNVNCPPPLNEKVLKDKRKKLKETWDRVLRLYYKEDPAKWSELKRMEIDYDKRRTQLIKFYESVKFAQQVQVDEIPLPDAPMMDSILPSQIPLPNELPLPELLGHPQSILKKLSAYESQPVKRAPGVPPGPPPDLSDYEDDEDKGKPLLTSSKNVEAMDTTEDKSTTAKPRKIRFADEEAKKVKKKKKSSDDEDEDDTDDDDDDDDKEDEEKQTKSMDDLDADEIPLPVTETLLPGSVVPALPPGPPPGLPRLPPGPPPLMFRPPPMRPGMPPPRLVPPGLPPLGRPHMPPGPPPGLPLRMGAPSMRIPPGPPPGIPPPRLIRPPGILPPGLPPPGILMPSKFGGQRGIGNVLSAPPSLIQRPKNARASDKDKKSATIEAKPQIRNLSADVMRFMPTALRIKREDRFKKGLGKISLLGEGQKDPLLVGLSSSRLAPHVSAPTKDDAYEQFMKEMENLL